MFETLNKIFEEKNIKVTASEPKIDKWLKEKPPFYNAISGQSISSVSCKGSANIRGTNNFNKKIKNIYAIPRNFFARELRSKVVYKLACIIRVHV